MPARRVPLVDRGRPARAPRRRAPAGAAEPERRPRAAARRRHRRLGRRLAGHDRPRQSRTAVARARPAARRDRSRRARARAAPHDLSRVRAAIPRPGSIPRCARRCSSCSDSEGLARDTGVVPGPRRPRHRRRCSPRPVPARRRRCASARCSTACVAGEEVGVDEIVTLLGARGPEVAARRRGRRRAAARHRRRRSDVRAEPQHQLHERLHVQVPVLRVLEGPAVAQPPRQAVSHRARGDATARRRSGRVRRDRGLPPGRDPSRLRRRLLRRRRPGREGGRARASTCTASPRSRSPKAPAGSTCRSTSTCCACKAAGLATLPGTAAEILDDEVRAIICPDKVNTEEWLEAHRTAHRVGLRSNVTIMHGTVERPVHVARHLVRTRDLQKETGGFTEFVPLPFVHMATPIFIQGKARRGPTFREVLLDARGRSHRVPRLDRQRAGVVGEVRCRGRPADPAGRRQRPRRHADGREHLARRRRQPRPGARRGRVPGDRRADRSHAGATHDALRPHRRPSARRPMRAAPETPPSGRSTVARRLSCWAAPAPSDRPSERDQLGQHRTALGSHG